MDGKISKEKIIVDTNIFLEFLLQQNRTTESLLLMKKIEDGTVEAYMTGYTLHSIEFTLDRRKQPKLLQAFLDQLMHAQGLQIYQTELAEEKAIAGLTQTINLDFDDALQYFAAKKLGQYASVLIMISTRLMCNALSRLRLCRWRSAFLYTIPPHKR